MVNFETQGAQFLSDSLVDKLLIQNKGGLPWKAKDGLALSMLETLLENNPYVDNAEVYHFQQGILGVIIQEKSAVVRIQGADQYYLDKAGNQFPISIHHIRNTLLGFKESSTMAMVKVWVIFHICNQFLLLIVGSEPYQVF